MSDFVVFILVASSFFVGAGIFIATFSDHFIACVFMVIAVGSSCDASGLIVGVY